MADIERLETALRNADAAGDFEAAKQIATAIKQTRQTSGQSSSSASMSGSGGAIDPAINDAQEKSSTKATRELPELFSSGILKGKDPLKVAQFAALAAVTPNEQELADIATSIFPEIGIQSDEGGNLILSDSQAGVSAVINKPGISKTDLAQLLGLGAVFNPAFRAGSGIVGQGAKQAAIQGSKGALASGGTQAAIEGAQYASGGQFDKTDIALTAAMQPTLQAGGEAVGAIKRAANSTASPEVQQVVKAGKDFKVPVLTSDVVPPETPVGGLTRQFAERIPFFGTGGMRAGQQQARKDAVSEFAESIPPVDDKAIIDSIKGKRDAIKNAASARYERIKSEMDAAGDVPTTNTIAKIDESIAELSKPGAVADNATIKDLQELKAALLNPQKFSLLRENRTYVSDLINRADPAGRSQLPTNTKRMLTQIRGAMSKDMDDFVQGKSPQTFLKYKEADAIYAEEARLLTKSRLKNVLDKGDVTPEQYRTLLFSSKPSEIALLYKSMGNGGREQSRNAILQHIVEKAGGIDNMTPATINRELKKAMPQIEVFFKGENKVQLKGFQRLLEATKRADEFKAITPTGQSLQAGGALALGAGAALQNPVAIAATVATALTAAGARAYESAPVRNLMVKLANSAKGSKAELQVLNELLPAIEAAGQTARPTTSSSSIDSIPR